MIEENRAEFERCRITDYHAAGMLGQGITIAALDDNEKPLPFMDYVEFPFGWFEKTNQHHSTKVIRVLHEVTPKARIISLPYIGPATTEDKRASIQWLMDNRERIDIINCSFHEWENDIFKRLKDLGIPIVCAAGNQGGSVNFPAKLPWTIAVGALEEYRDAVAGYSNKGSEVDCLGYTKVSIPTTKPGQPMEFSGTSASAPMVAGMLALIGKLDRWRAHDSIEQNCIDYYEEGHDWGSGYGLFVLPKMEDGKMKYTKDHIPVGRVRPGTKMTPESIAIHSTGNAKSTAKNERAWLTNPTNDRLASWHVVVGEKEAIEAIPLDEVAYHAGSKAGNNSSIGIELCESGDRSMVIANAVELVAKLLKERNWGVNRLKRHYDWSGKDCPRIMSANNWQGWREFVDKIRKELEKVAETPNTSTVDTPSPWAKNSWEWAVKEGIIDGTNPRGNVTREQLAAILERLAYK